MIGQTLSHYRITAKLGEGGMGEVYRAEDTSLKREVALKILPPELAGSQERLERFQREAEALAALDHPNIVAIYSVEEADGVRFLTMQLVDGQALSESVSDDGLPIEQFFDLAIPLADALSEAHERGIVHRDLKPANVMVDAKGRPKILDFGLAKLCQPEMSAGDISQLATATFQEAMTQEGKVLGTFPYMSPEQAEGKAVDHRSDLFSLGVLLYEIVAGRRPFEGDTSASLISSILRDTPSPVSELREDLPEPLAQVIARCLEKVPERRYESAKALRDDLESSRRQALLGDVVRQTGKRQRWLRPSMLGLGAVVVLSIVVGTLTWRSDRQTDGASQQTGSQVAAESIHSIAVLPLLNLSGDPEQDYFADGMTEALINSLARINALKVTSRTSIMRFKGTELSLPEIARELGVEAVVEGSVQRQADMVRVSAQLIDATTDRQLWGDTFERALEGALQLQSEVARSIADAVAVTVSSGETNLLINTREVNPETYEAYLRGMHFLNKGTPEGLEKGMAYLRQAVDTDPADPLGYAGLASGYVILGHTTGDAEYIRRAKAAARTALELDDSQAEAQATLAKVAMYFDWDWNAADEAFQRALELNPSQAEVHSHYSALHTLRGDLERTLAEHDLARELDPLSPSVAVWQAEFLWPFGLYEKAEAAARTALELNPGFPHAHAWLGQAYLGLGRLDEALEHARIAAEGNPRWVPWLGRVLVAVGRMEEARVLLEELLANPEAGHTLVELAIFQAAYGDLDGAMATLGRAHEIREVFMPWIGSWADLGDLTDDMRFQDLLARMNLEFVRPRLLAEAAEG